MLGYSGTMGQRIVRLLHQHLPSLKVIGASRSPSTNDTLETRVINYQDAASLLDALHDVDFLIHAAGPFQHDPEVLLNACIAQQVHYIDIAESLNFIQSVKKAADKRTNCRSFIISGCSTVPGLVSCLAQKFSHLDRLSKIQISLNLGSSNPVSPGLCFSLLRPLGLSIKGGKKSYRQFITIPHLDNKTRHYGNYPIPFEHGLAVSKKIIPIKFFMGFDRRVINYLLLLSSFITNRLSDSQLMVLCRCIIPFAGIAKVFGGEAGHLSLIAKDQDGSPLAQIEIKAEKEGLDIPAVTAIWAIQALLENMNSEKDKPEFGFTELQHLVEASSAINKLRELGYEVLEKNF